MLLLSKHFVNSLFAGSVPHVNTSNHMPTCLSSQKYLVKWSMSVVTLLNKCIMMSLRCLGVKTGFSKGEGEGLHPGFLHSPLQMFVPENGVCNYLAREKMYGMLILRICTFSPPEL